MSASQREKCDSALVLPTTWESLWPEKTAGNRGHLGTRRAPQYLEDRVRSAETTLQELCPSSLFQNTCVAACPKPSGGHGGTGRQGEATLSTLTPGAVWIHFWTRPSSELAGSHWNPGH